MLIFMAVDKGRRGKELYVTHSVDDQERGKVLGPDEISQCVDVIHLALARILHCCGMWTAGLISLTLIKTITEWCGNLDAKQSIETRKTDSSFWLNATAILC